MPMRMPQVRASTQSLLSLLFVSSFLKSHSRTTSSPAAQTASASDWKAIPPTSPPNTGAGSAAGRGAAAVKGACDGPAHSGVDATPATSKRRNICHGQGSRAAAVYTAIEEESHDKASKGGDSHHAAADARRGPRSRQLRGRERERPSSSSRAASTRRGQWQAKEEEEGPCVQGTSGSSSTEHGGASIRQGHALATRRFQAQIRGYFQQCTRAEAFEAAIQASRAIEEAEAHGKQGSRSVRTVQYMQYALG
jgi:hypothetical protein